MAEPVLRELSDGVLLLTLNRPEKKNAFDDAQWNALRDALDEAREDRAVACAVVTGAGKDFSAGQDLAAFGGSLDAGEDGKVGGYAGFMPALYAFDKPLLAAARGVGVGIGATFLLHCDVVYVGESVRLRLPFVGLGLVPEAASSYLLQAAIGPQRAAELFFSAEWIDAAKAVSLGIAARAFPDDELLTATLAKARAIAEFPVSALQGTKRTLLASRASGIQTAHAAEIDGMAALAGSPENMEAIAAFLEKRKPNFRQFRES